MTKERARDRRRKRLQETTAGHQIPRWKPPILIFFVMLLVISVLRGLQKGASFGWPDMIFVVLFAATMSLFAYIRPKLFNS